MEVIRKPDLPVIHFMDTFPLIRAWTTLKKNYIEFWYQPQKSTNLNQLVL
jgi:hypothetical protein